MTISMSLVTCLRLGYIGVSWPVPRGAGPALAHGGSGALLLKVVPVPPAKKATRFQGVGAHSVGPCRVLRVERCDRAAPIEGKLLRGRCRRGLDWLDTFLSPGFGDRSTPSGREVGHLGPIARLNRRRPCSEHSSRGHARNLNP